MQTYQIFPNVERISTSKKVFNLVTPENFQNWKTFQAEQNNVEKNGIYSIVQKVTNIYLSFEWLQNCCIKQFKKFGGLDLAYLVESSTLKSITREARKYAAGIGENYTMKDDHDARVLLSSEIYETCLAIC